MVGLVFTQSVMVEVAAFQMARAYLAQWPDVEYVSLSYRSPEGKARSVGVMR